MEQWVVVDWLDGYRGVLSVSNTARVRRTSYTYETTGRWGTLHTTTKPDKIISSYVEKNGYATVAVQVAGKRKKFQLHHLVARAFCTGYEPGLCVNHINGVKTDNRPSNLEWVTLAQNTKHAWSTGLVNLRGENSPLHKLTSGQVRIIRRLLKLGASSNELAVLVGVDVKTITGIRDGLKWSHLSY